MARVSAELQRQHMHNGVKKSLVESRESLMALSVYNKDKLNYINDDQRNHKFALKNHAFEEQYHKTQQLKSLGILPAKQQAQEPSTVFITEQPFQQIIVPKKQEKVTLTQFNNGEQVKLQYNKPLNRLIDLQNYIPVEEQESADQQRDQLISQLQEDILVQRASIQDDAEFDLQETLQKSATKIQHAEFDYNDIDNYTIPAQQESGASNSLVPFNNLGERDQDAFLHQHLVVEALISSFQNKFLPQFKSPFFALQNFMGQHLDANSGKQSIKHGQQFRAELGMFCIEKIVSIIPPIWQPMLHKIIEVFDEVLFVNAPNRDFKQTYKSLFEELQVKHNNLLRETQAIREKFRHQKAKVKCNRKLVDFFRKMKDKEFIGRVFHELKEETNLAKRLSSSNMNTLTSKNVLMTMNNRVQTPKQQVDSDHILMKRTFDAFKFYKLMCKQEKTKGLCDLLKAKIDEIETIKFQQQTQIKELSQELVNLNLKLDKTVEGYEKEVSKLMIYKHDAEHKKPLEIQMCLKAFMTITYRTNILVRQLQISHKYSGQPVQAMEQLSIVKFDNEAIKVKGFGDNSIISKFSNFEKLKIQPGQVYLQHLILNNREQIFGQSQLGVKGMLEKQSIQNIVLRWVRFVKMQAIQSFDGIIENKHEEKKQLGFKLIKTQMEFEKLEERLQQMQKQQEQKQFNLDLKKLEDIDTQKQLQILQSQFAAKQKQINSVQQQIDKISKTISYLHQFTTQTNKIDSKSKENEDIIPSQTKMESSQLLNIETLMLVMMYLAKNNKVDNKDTLEKLIIDFMINSPSNANFKMEENNSQIQSMQDDLDLETIFNSQEVKQFIDRENEHESVKQNYVRVQRQTKQIKLIQQVLAQEFKVDLNAVIPYYDFFQNCASGQTSHIFLLLYQVLFLKDNETLLQPFKPLVEEQKDRNQLIFNLKHDPVLVAQDLENSNDAYRMLRELFEQKLKPITSHMFNNSIQDVFQLLSVEEQNKIVVHQNKLMRTQALNSVKYSIDLLEKQADLDAEYRSNLSEANATLGLDQDFMEGKDPFMVALQFVRGLSEDQLILRWLNFISKSFQKQEHEQQFEHKLQVRFLAKKALEQQPITYDKVAHKKQRGTVIDPFEKPISSFNMSLDGSKVLNRQSFIDKLDHNQTSIMNLIVDSPQKQLASNIEIGNLTEEEIKQLDPNEDLFDKTEFTELIMFEQLVVNDFELFIKIICYIAPELLFQAMEVDSLKMQQIQRISTKYHETDEENEANEQKKLSQVEKVQVQEQPEVYPQIAKVCVLCDHFLNSNTTDIKHLFIVNSVFKITNRLDLINIDLIQKISQTASINPDFVLPQDQLTQFKKILAALFVSRPMMNTHQGTKTAGLRGTVFTEQVSIVQEFFETQRKVLNKFGKVEYANLEGYINQLNMDKAKVESALQYINVCDKVYKESVKPKMLNASKLTPSTMAVIQDTVNTVINASNMHHFHRIDKQMNFINFAHVASLIKCSHLSLSWSKKIIQTITSSFNIPLKQLFVNRLHLLRKYPENQRNFTGFISYWKVSWLLYNLNLNTVKLRNDEVEFLLFQFVFLKISEFKSVRDEEAKQQEEHQQNMLAQEDFVHDQQQMQDKKEVITRQFMNRMKGQLQQSREKSEPPVFNRDLPTESLLRRNFSLKTARNAPIQQEPSNIVTSNSWKQQREQILLRQNLYSYKFTVSDLVEILLVVIFSSNLSRRQIIEEMVTQRCPVFFKRFYDQQIGQSGSSQVSKDQRAGANNTLKQKPNTVVKGKANDLKKTLPPAEEPKIDPNIARLIVDFLDKSCLANPTVGQAVFEQFLTHCLLTEKSLVRTRSQAGNQSSFTAYMGNFRIQKLDQIFNDVQVRKTDLASVGQQLSRRAMLKQKKAAIIDESFTPYKKVLIAVYDYYLIEYGSTLNNQKFAQQNRMLKQICMHLNVFGQFLSDFSQYQDKSSPFASQLTNYPATFRLVWKEMTGVYVDIGAKRSDGSESQMNGASSNRKSRQFTFSSSIPDKEKQANQLLQSQIDLLEQKTERAQYMVFSEFFEILFRFAIFSNQDPNKSDMLKFKEFLLNEVFSSLKFQLRIREGEELQKPHKARIARMLQRMNKIF